MELKIAENVSHVYTISEDLIPEYKEWVTRFNTKISKQSFWEFLICNYCIDDFEEDTYTNDVEIENFEEFINQ